MPQRPPHPDDPALISAMVYQSEAYQINLRFEELTTEYFVLERNYEELVRILRGGQSPQAYERLWTQDKSFEMGVILREIVRLLYNYVASAQTLIEHLRNRFREWYADTEFLAAYKDEVAARFGDDPIAGFIEDLRDYSYHYALPVTVAAYKQYHDPATGEPRSSQAFVLERADLQKWGRWNSRSRRFLDMTEGQIVIEAIANHYQELANGFKAWLFQRLATLHSADLQWLEEMAQRVSMSLEQMRLARTAPPPKPDGAA